MIPLQIFCVPLERGPPSMSITCKFSLSRVCLIYLKVPPVTNYHFIFVLVGWPVLHLIFKLR